MTGEEFISEKLRETVAALDVGVLNKGKWDALREDRRMLVFLQQRAAAPDFEGVRSELQRVVDGHVRVPDISGPRARAADCLHNWRIELEGLD